MLGSLLNFTNPHVYVTIHNGVQTTTFDIYRIIKIYSSNVANSLYSIDFGNCVVVNVSPEDVEKIKKLLKVKEL